MIRVAGVVVLLVPALAAARPHCPHGKALVAMAQAAWNTVDVSGEGAETSHRDVSAAELDCVEVHGTQPELLIFDRNGALLLGRDVTWHRLDPDCTPGSSHTYDAADLDGDGTDELIVIEDHWGHMGYGSQSLAIAHVVDGEVVGSEADMRLGSIDGDHIHNRCWARVRPVAGPGKTLRLEITGITDSVRGREKPDPAGCALPGPRLYDWVKGTLVLVKS